MREQIKNSYVIVIIISAIFGLASGFVADLVFKTYFNDIYNTPFSGELDFTNRNLRGSNLVISEPKKVVVEQNDKVNEILNSVRGSLVGIYKNGQFVTVESEEGTVSTNMIKIFNSENFYAIGQESGQGFIITSDGWILANLKIDDMKQYSIVTADKKIYRIDKILLSKITPFIFLHINAKDLPVRKFAGQEEIRAGQISLASNWNGKSLLTSITNASDKSKDLVRSSDLFFNKIALADNPSGNFVIFNLSGDVIGFADKSGKVEPIYHFFSSFKSLLKDKTVKLPSLGVNYIDLAWLVDIRQNPKSTYDKGAILVKNSDKIPAVLPGSSAALAGLREGDIIITVENTEINRDNNLTDIIMNYQPADIITLGIIRNGEKLDIEVKLGEIK